MKISEKKKIDLLAYTISLLAVYCHEHVGSGHGSIGYEILGITDAVRGLDTQAAYDFKEGYERGK